MERGITPSRENCNFQVNELKFLGHQKSDRDESASKSKVETR